MDTRQIRTLLERYFEGRTTLQEEQALGNYFATGPVDRDLLQYREQFVLFREMQGEGPVVPDFEHRLERLIDSQDEKVMTLRRPWIGVRWAAAAGLAILLGIGAYLVLDRQAGRNRDTFADAEIAYAEVQKTLLYVSSRINQGMKPLSAVSKINAGSEPLKKLEKLDTGMEMLNMVSIISNTSNLKK